MSFGLGVLAGYGSAQREVNVRTHEEGLAAEKAKNEQTANLIHDFILRPDITPEMGQAGLQALMQFSSTPGIPTAKHRSEAMEQVLGAMQKPRTFVSPDVQAKRTQGQTDQSAGAGMTAAAAGPAGGAGMTSIPAIPAFGAPGAAMSARGVTEAATPMPGGDTRTGLLSKEEQAVIAGHAMGSQMRAMSDSMGSLPGFGGGGAGPGTGGVHVLMLPNGKGGVSPHIINDSEQLKRARYIDPDTGEPREGAINYNRKAATATDGTGRPVILTDLMTPDGWMTMTGVGPDGTPTKTVTTKSEAADVGPVKQYVPKKFINVKNADNTVSTVPISPATGRVTGPATATGVVQTDPQLARTVAGTNATIVGTDIKRRGFKATVDPSYGSDLPTPAGQPIVDINGTPTQVGTRQFMATKQPASVIQRSSTARVAMQQGQDVLKVIEDPANAALFGKLQGRWNQLQTEGPEMFGKKFIGPLGTNDPKLAHLHAALKSISDLLVTVHGRRDSQSARNFEQSMGTVNSPQALAAVVRQYTQDLTREVAAEAGRTTVPVTGASGASTSGTGSPAATHVYVPGKGAVPITSTVPAGPP